MLGLDTTIGLLRGCGTRHRAFDLAFDFLRTSWRSVTLLRITPDGMTTVCSTDTPHSMLSLTWDVAVCGEPRYLFQCSHSVGERPTRAALLELRCELGAALSRLERTDNWPTRPIPIRADTVDDPPRTAARKDGPFRADTVDDPPPIARRKRVPSRPPPIPPPGARARPVRPSLPSSSDGAKATSGAVAPTIPTARAAS